MRLRATLVAMLMIAITAMALASGGDLVTAQTPTVTPSATGTAVPLAPCPTGRTLLVAAPTAAAPTTVTVTIAPALANLKAASAADPTSLHVHYFVDTPAAAAGTVIPTGNAAIIHSGSLSQDLGPLGAGSHTVTVVVGQLDHRACDLRGQVTFTTTTQAAPTAAVTPPKTGSGGLLGQASEATSSALGLAVLALGTLVAAGGAAIAARRR